MTAARFYRGVWAVCFAALLPACGILREDPDARVKTYARYYKSDTSASLHQDWRIRTAVPDEVLAMGLDSLKTANRDSSRVPRRYLEDFVEGFFQGLVYPELGEYISAYQGNWDGYHGAMQLGPFSESRFASLMRGYGYRKISARGTVTSGIHLTIFRPLGDSEKWWMLSFSEAERIDDAFERAAGRSFQVELEGWLSASKTYRDEASKLLSDYHRTIYVRNIRVVE